MSPQPFIATKQHRRFIEFADAVRRQRTIGICFGQAGTGKTLSAKRYANWHKAETLLDEWGPRDDSDSTVYAALARCRARRNLGFSGVKLGFWDFGAVLKEVLGTAESLLSLLRNSPGNPPP